MGQVDSDWLAILARLGGPETLALSARAHGAFLRARGIRCATDVLRLAFMYGPGGHSLRSLAAVAAAHGLADVSDVAVLDRLKRAADWLQSLCAESLARVAKVIGGIDTTRPIRIVDGSRLEGPGDRAWRLHMCYDPGLGRIVDAAITTTALGERLDRLAITPGEIRLGDRGFPKPEGLRNTLDAGADVLVRLTWKSLQLTTPEGRPLDWLNLFKLTSKHGLLDMPVRVHKAHSRFEPVEMRLVIIKKPAAAAARARRKARRASTKNQHRTDPRTLAAADHLILLTSLDAGEFPVSRLGALYRLRWQIELAFKRLKSILHIDRLPAKNPELARTWLYAHLLLALLIEEAVAGLDAISPSATACSPSATAWPPNVAMAHRQIARRRTARSHLAAA
jgi:hypothetical protein